jgi:hypothetical protein
MTDVLVPLAGSLDDAAPYPVPAGRGRWRLTLHARSFVGGGYGTAGAPWQSTILAVLTQARSRRVERGLDKAATLTFTVDGRDPIASAIRELQVEVMAWRWDDWQGRDVCVGRFIVDRSEDQISEQTHVVTFGAHDYLAMLERRMITDTAARSWTYDQDTLVETLVQMYGVNARTMPGVTFLPGAWLPVYVVIVGPAGTARALSGRSRTRVYQPGTQLSALLDDLAHVDQGYEYDVLPAPEAAGLGYMGPTLGPLPANVDALRIFYPSQGVVRADLTLVYGGNVSTLTRTVSSADYGNRVWAVGNIGVRAARRPLDGHTQRARRIGSGDTQRADRRPARLRESTNAGVHARTTARVVPLGLPEYRRRRRPGRTVRPPRRTRGPARHRRRV